MTTTLQAFQWVEQSHCGGGSGLTLAGAYVHVPPNERTTP